MNSFQKLAYEIQRGQYLREKIARWTPEMEKSLADFGITKEANKLLQSIERLGIRGGKKGLMDHVKKNPDYLRSGGPSGNWKPEGPAELEVAKYLSRIG